MALSGSFSPKMSLTKSFGSSLRVTEFALDDDHEGGSRRRSSAAAAGLAEYADKRKHVDVETSPKSETTGLLTGDTDDEVADGRLSAELLTTIIVVTIGSSLQFGYGTGVMNNSEAFILKYFHDQGKEYTVMQWGTTVSCFGIGGLLGAIIGPKIIGQYCGRRATLMINNIFLIISSYLIAFAPVWWWQALGRIFIGIVAGVATSVVPTYFSEISPIAVRGAVGTMHQLGITLGILVAQALSTPSLNLLGSEEQWQWLFLVPVLCGLLEVIVLPFCPESPSYIFMTQGKESARKSLVRLQSEGVADEYLGYIEEEIEGAKGMGGNMTVWKLFADRNLRKQLIVGITVQLMMQFSGIDAVFYYSTSVFYQADVPDPELATTCLGVINVIVTIFAVKFMDTAGRKTLLKYSWIGMCTSYIVLTLSFLLKPYVPYMNQVCVVSMTGIIIFFAFGPGCIAWFIIAEIFPLYARDTAMAVGIFINWVANWLVAFTFPLLLEYVGPSTFIIFVCTTAYFYYFTVRFVPETKGLTVAQVTDEFKIIPLSTC